MLKRLTVTLLICVLLCLTACSKPPAVPEPEEFDPSEPLTICFDLDNWLGDPRHMDLATGKYTGAKQRQAAVDQFLQDLKDAGGPENVQVEFIEDRGSDRDGQLTHLRAEIMAGSGPDLFVLKQTGESDLFLFPEKKLEDGLFLALDKYMENARFMEPDKMLKPVFDAGKSADGRQFLLPMTYDIDAAVLRESWMDFDHTAPHSFEEMLDSGTKLGSVLSLWKVGEPGYNSLIEVYPALGQLADYKKESLNFTQEELGEFFDKLLEYDLKAEDGGIKSPSGLLLGNLTNLHVDVADRVWAREPVALVPLYDRDGGVTARVNFFAGVNANTKNPAGAFWAADFLLGRDYMLDSDLYMYMWSDTLPIYTDLLGPDTHVPYIRSDNPANDFYHGFTGQHWEAYQTLMGLITGAEFPSQLDSQLGVAYARYYQAEDDSAREKVVSEVYSTMRMMLGES